MSQPLFHSPRSTDIADVDRAELTRGAGPAPRVPWVIMNYDTRRFPFAAVLSRDVYKVRRLDRLHDYWLEHRARLSLPRRLQPEDNRVAGAMMARQPGEAAFWKLYHAFMLDELAPLVGRGLSYTCNPKLRVHFSGTPSISSFHHDLYVTKRIDQINFWIPFTDVEGGATLWLESDYGCADFAPVPVRYGQVLIFDGGYLGHGSVANQSDITRISLDMRFSYRRATSRAEGVSLLDRILDGLARRNEPLQSDASTPAGTDESVSHHPPHGRDPT